MDMKEKQAWENDKNKNRKCVQTDFAETTRPAVKETLTKKVASPVPALQLPKPQATDNITQSYKPVVPPKLLRSSASQ